ncbi:MAG: tetratricopeptide repeat protein [Rhodomicrobium sp.]
MQISKLFYTIRISAAPVLFSAVALGLVATQISLQRKAERAKAQTVVAMAAQQRALAEKMVSLKFGDLAQAAAAGDLPSRIEIGRRLALGQGVKKDEGEAVLYFQGVINQFGEINARDKRGPLVATALRYMAWFHLTGVAEANLPSNPAYAFSLLHHAASYFGDPAAQYELAKLLINGEGVAKNSRAGAQWLLTSSRKGYIPAQALLGQLLWRGDGIKRVPGDGLGLLAIARRNASPDDKGWVTKMFEAARSEALPIEILEANAFIVQEASVSHFGPVNDSLISSNSGSPVRAGSAASEPSRLQAGREQSSIIQGNPHGFSELQANPMAFPSDSFDREVASGKSDVDTPAAGILQMYRPSGFDPRIENSAPVRLAGVSN